MLVEKFNGKHRRSKKFTANDMLHLFGARLTPNKNAVCFLAVLQAVYPGE
jgi:hypothetical protein